MRYILLLLFILLPLIMSAQDDTSFMKHDPDLLFFGKTLYQDNGASHRPGNRYLKYNGKWYKYYSMVTEIIEGFKHHYFTEILSIIIEGDYLITKTKKFHSQEHLSYISASDYRLIKEVLKDFK